MTKIKEKLEELGYEFDVDVELHSQKIYSIYSKIVEYNSLFLDRTSNKIVLNIGYGGKVCGYYVCQNCIRHQYEIDALQHAYGVMQNDLSILKGVSNQ